ncbi:hypothetical protein SKAU_G00207220 [Synaphobranchus kaupii]|uniref:Uncharacterized protein n=1 Tax=Synaphobranchus kaupii TaxID=118154 RepID=A0A9Q1F8A9_SYNKA|nr:hypothetical protein SKAU_G00207220 [Synaphobranchus kaupii]
MRQSCGGASLVTDEMVCDGVAAFDNEPEKQTKGRGGCFVFQCATCRRRHPFCSLSTPAERRSDQPTAVCLAKLAAARGCQNKRATDAGISWGGAAFTSSLTRRQRTCGRKRKERTAAWSSPISEGGAPCPRASVHRNVGRLDLPFGKESEVAGDQLKERKSAEVEKSETVEGV